MGKYLITGGAGFFGTIMKKTLLERGDFCVSIDLEPDDYAHENFVAIQGDIRNITLLDELFSKYDFDAVFHFAAMLAHEKKALKELWSSNVDGTQNVLDMCIKHNVNKIIFTSSNCLWGKNFDYKVTEDEAPAPVEIYGKSKLEGEKILMSAKGTVNSVIFRCPTIMDEGRLGLLAILYEFVDENKKLWMVGKGNNTYQFIYAKDLANACMLALDYNKSEIFNIGSDDVKSFNYIYQYVVDHSDSTSKLGHLPPNLAKLAMKVSYYLGISPLGVYQYNMISSSFVFDTTKIKRELNWQPTLKNEEMLLKSYNYFHENKEEIKNRTNVSAHNREADMGLAIRILKFFS
ncbi:MAG: NAD(P)-dependent oxidoreductase [Eubacterium sp.]|nr:NAD(P)-dependent oxidoreductase [Eubacterium sp.]MBR2277630.1 NAD(P)-dependent oxidoreductase [Eubacterium sp.]